MQNFESTNKKSGKTIIGFVLLALGCILLLRTLNLYFLPGYLFSWPMWLIVIGLYIGARKGYQKPAPFILILLGFVFLSQRILPDLEISRFVWPLAIIGFGLWMVLRPGKNKAFQRGSEWDKRVDPLSGENINQEGEPRPFTNAEPFQTIEDRVNTTSIFGGIKKTVMSKNFLGGEVVNFFGGAELNLMQADIQGKVRLEVTQVFGGTKIIVPANWTIHSEMVAIFGSIEDKRLQPHEPNPDKMLIIEGTSLFGGIDVRSF